MPRRHASRSFLKSRLALGALFALAAPLACGGRDAAQARDGDMPRVVVAPPSTNGTPPGWSVDGYATSLAAAIGRIATVESHAGSGREADADYIVEGDVHGENGRFVLTLRVREAGRHTTLWSATFWRESLADSTLTGDLARAVAEAIHRTKAVAPPTTSTSTTKEKP